MINMPEVKIGIVAVSRDCFPESLSVNRRKALTEAYKKKYDASNLYECPICIVESELHMVQALEDYLGNFGPEISETLLAKHFDGPSMFIAAAEESGNNLVQGRGDAYCGMLNASYNLKLRNIKAYIPEYPVGTAEECADMIAEFVPIARAVIGLSSLKIIPLTSLHAMRRLSSFTIWGLRLRKTRNWICSRHLTAMQGIPASRMW